MFESLIKKIHKHATGTTTGVVYRMWEHGGWGNSIRFFDWGTRKITGHFSGLRVGDELQSRMESGKTGRFLITEIEYYDDPPDMFFGTVRDMGYVEP